MDIEKLKELIHFKKIKHYDNWDMYYLFSSLGYPSMFDHSPIRGLGDFIYVFTERIRELGVSDCSERIDTLLSFNVEDTYHVKLNVEGNPTNYTTVLSKTKSKSKSKSKSPTKNKTRNDNIRNCGRYRRNLCGKRAPGDNIFIHYGDINYNVAGLADVYDYPGLLSVKPIRVKKTRKITTSTIEGPGNDREKEATDYEKMQDENIFIGLGTHSIDRSDELPSMPLLDTEISMITLSYGWRVKGIINSKHKIVICNEIEHIPRDVPFNLHDLTRYYNSASHFTKEFYESLLPIPPTFLDGLAQAKNVRLIALCHGCILEPFTPAMKVRRISATVPGICGMTQFNHKVKQYHFFERIREDDDIFIPAALEQTTAHIKKIQCVKNWNKNSMNNAERSRRNRMHDVCTKLESAPNKTLDTMFNKSFGNDYGLNFLLIGYKTEHGYKYINLFSLVEDIDLRDIGNFIPSCKDLILVDMSCSMPCDNYRPSKDNLGTY